MDTKQKKLNERLLAHDFDSTVVHQQRYAQAKTMAEHYTTTENAVAVLSDMVQDLSYICYGRLGEKLGLGTRTETEEVDSIWEKKILDRIHPDDVAEKLAWELQFLSFIRQQPVSERANYYLQHFLRIQDLEGHYHYLRHRIFYLDFSADDNVTLVLCLYTAVNQSKGTAGIINSLEDTVVNDAAHATQGILSERERGILLQISRGLPSKQIADALNISINTVNNHRQNIMRKLNCQNTTQAVGVARALGLLRAD